MEISCFCEECKYQEDRLCGIAKDGIDQIRIGESGECLSLEYKDDEEEPGEEDK